MPLWHFIRLRVLKGETDNELYQIYKWVRSLGEHTIL